MGIREGINNLSYPLFSYPALSRDSSIKVNSKLSLAYPAASVNFATC